MYPVKSQRATNRIQFCQFKITVMEEMTKFSEFFSKGGGHFLRGGEMVSHGDSTVK